MGEKFGAETSDFGRDLAGDYDALRRRYERVWKIPGDTVEDEEKFISTALQIDLKQVLSQCHQISLLLDTELPELTPSERLSLFKPRDPMLDRIRDGTWRKPPGNRKGGDREPRRPVAPTRGPGAAVDLPDRG
jgi:hypothetical protein